MSSGSERLSKRADERRLKRWRDAKRERDDLVPSRFAHYQSLCVLQMIEDALSSPSVRSVDLSRADLQGRAGVGAARVVRFAMERVMQRAWAFVDLAGRVGLEQALFLPERWGRRAVDMGRKPHSQRRLQVALGKATEDYSKFLKKKIGCRCCQALSHKTAHCSPFFKNVASRRDIREMITKQKSGATTGSKKGAVSKK